jgi:hypothetical protein
MRKLTLETSVMPTNTIAHATIEQARSPAMFARVFFFNA